MRMRFPALVAAAVLCFPSLSTAFCFARAGRMYDISPRLLEAIAWVESRRDPSALGRNRNGSRDYGLMQINSSWAGVFGEDWSLVRSDPCYNVLAGAWILRRCMDRYGENWKAVGCYHAGSAGGRRAWLYVRKVRQALGRIEK